ncbi:MAG: carboxypeptidase regulatory-like domain-containing protein [Terriglobales bacterium]
MRIQAFVSTALLLLLLVCGAGPRLQAQSSTTGMVAGSVLDPSGAAIPAAQVTLHSAASNAVSQVQTGAHGHFQFSYIKPGAYTVAATATGFARLEQPVQVTVGQTTSLTLALRLGTSGTTVQVTASNENIQTQDGQVSTAFTERQIQQLPNPGQDITSYVQLAPGAVMDTGGAAGGHVSFYGLPTTANLFQLNGMDDTSYYSNVNSSGASNLTLGANEIATATTITNAYSGQYGRLAGAQVDYVTKSGTNQWHGDADYFWNGRALNANDYFNNARGVPRPFSNANQWATALGGPIVKNQTFFFVDFEGVRVVLPAVTNVNIPSPQYQTATLANLTKKDPAAVPLYKQLFGVYNSAPGAAAASPLAGGCGTFTTLGAGVPCALQFGAATDNLTTEWQLAARVDQNFGASDQLFFRVQNDRGLQATSTSPFATAFNTYSNQPEWQGQLHETHAFGSTAVNEFSTSLRWISAEFGPNDVPATLQALPFSFAFVGSAFTSVGFSGLQYNGRDETLYLIGDNYSWIHGAHTLRAGFTLRRDLISDFALAVNTAGTATSSVAGFYNGQVQSFAQAFADSYERPLALYSLGFYGEDDWQTTRNLSLTLSLRMDHNSNPVCVTDCFGRLQEPFESLDHSAATPYNAALTANAPQAFFSGTGLTFEPRVGFAWTLFGSKSTVLRGGFGLFNEGLPALVANSFAVDSPAENTFTVTGSLAPAGVSGSAPAAAQADNAAFASGFSQGATLASLQASVKGFTPPNFFTSAGSISDAVFREWNLELQHAFGAKTTVAVNYVGNAGIHEPFESHGLNAYCPASLCPSGFAGLPSAPVDPRFGTVTELTTTGVSNYNGLTLSFERQASSGLTLTANYTYGHALDDVSNGGLQNFDTVTDTSVLAAQNPNNPGANYGNADYDVRHSLVAGLVWQPQVAGTGAKNTLLGHWVIAGNIFTRSGLPLTVIDQTLASELAPHGNSGGPIFANYLGGAQPGCSVESLCLDAGDFSSPSAAFGQQERNQFRGPAFFDADLSLKRQFPLSFLSEQAHFSLGAQAFNVLNHPNFALPVSNLSSPQFGQILSTVGVPTSPMGASLGGDASPRLIQVNLSLVF